MVNKAIKKLVTYGLLTGLINEEERIYSTNLLLEILQQDSYEDEEIAKEEIDLPSILEELIKEGLKKKLFLDTPVNRDLFDTKLMNALTPRPSSVIKDFANYYKKSPEEATHFFYKFSQDTNYIRRDRIRKDRKWETKTPYGTLNITINLAKPEKDPKAIEALGKMKSNSYPKCQLCLESVGYKGRLDYPARQNHRVIPLTIKGEPWFLQYSPYVYYKEHCILLNNKHVPMKIKKETFVKLFDFVKQFPHYFIGSNADLPIVGGSILSHEHFQGGNFTFPMAKANITETFKLKDFPEIEAGILNWPTSTIRLRSINSTALIEGASLILEKWQNYSDPALHILAYTKEVPHNTITPIVRYTKGKYEIDLALRNNRTTKEYPLGIFHPHSEYHHIKKENIGLIEVMGLAVLPARLQKEMKLLATYLVEEKSLAEIKSNDSLAKHGDWVQEIRKKYPVIKDTNVTAILQEEIGLIFSHVLEDTGVFKLTEEGRAGFRRFIKHL